MRLSPSDRSFLTLFFLVLFIIVSSELHSQFGLQIDIILEDRDHSEGEESARPFESPVTKQRTPGEVRLQVQLPYLVIVFLLILFALGSLISLLLLGDRPCRGLGSPLCAWEQKRCSRRAHQHNTPNEIVDVLS